MYSDYYNMNNQYYAVNNINTNIPTFNSEEIISLNQAIEQIRMSVGNEKEDEIFYDTLIKQAQSQKEKEIISSIRDDEKKHNEILRSIYYQLTGQIIPKNNNTNMKKDLKTYKQSLEKALFGELEAVKKYRKIMAVMMDKYSYTLLMSIMTDELRHANMYNFLIHNAK